MRRLSMHSKCLALFSFKFWVWGEGRIFSFSFVPNMFPLKFSMGSHQVPNMLPRFPMCSPRVFPIAPIFIHMFCRKSSPSHVYTWAKGRGTPSFHRFFYIWGASIGSIFFCYGPIKLAHSKRKKVGLLTHPN